MKKEWKPGRFVLGFDLGANGAVAIMSLIEEGAADEVETHRLSLPGNPDELARRAHWWKDAAVNLLSLGPLAVAYEDANFSGAKGASQNWLRRLEGILLAECEARSILCVGASTPTVRAHMRRVGVPKWGKGETKVASQRSAAFRGWIPMEWVGVKRYEDQADAAWVADWLRHEPIEVVK